MRLIDADRLLPKLKKIRDMINPRLIGGKAVRELTLIIIKYFENEQFQIDPESLRKHALWMKIICSFLESENNAAYVCSNCGWYRGDLRFKYCPDCGAKMDLEVK